MRIELRDSQRQRVGRIDLDPAQRPTRAVIAESDGAAGRLSRWARGLVGRARYKHVPKESSKLEQGEGVAQPAKEVFLNWETALDDAGQLRRCIACGCTDMFREKSFPQVTGFVVLLAFIGAVVGALGLATNLPVLFAMACVLVLDIAILVLSRRRLVCYDCRTTYLNLPIARYHRPWDRGVADRHPSPVRSKAVPNAPIVESESNVTPPAQPSLRTQKGSLA
jgi:hypothetical protein